MPLGTDVLLDRMQLKSQLKRWRAAAVLLATLALLIYFKDISGIIPERSYVAKVDVTGIILDDYKQIEVLKDLADNSDVEAVIVYIDSPGGTVVGGESYYNALREVSVRKPVVSVMGTIATSAGYMVALGTEQVFASRGTLTGSIGVILHSAEVLKLAEKFGVDFKIFKSGKFKATPSPFEHLTPEGEKVIQNVINDYQDVFVDMVAQGRKMPHDSVKLLADGRVFTGQQAVEFKLVDAIGDIDGALKWLQTNKNISTDRIKEIPLFEEEKGISEIFSALGGIKPAWVQIFSSQGLLSVWLDGMM